MYLLLVAVSHYDTAHVIKAGLIADGRIGYRQGERGVGIRAFDAYDFVYQSVILVKYTENSAHDKARTI